MTNYIYMIIDRTDKHHTKRFRSVHSSRESAEVRMAQYTEKYSIMAKGLVEIVKVYFED